MCVSVSHKVKVMYKQTVDNIKEYKNSLKFQRGLALC